MTTPTPTKDTTASWEKFLNPKTLRQNLVAASVYLAAYEMLKQALIDQLRGFYSNSWSAEDGWIVSESYGKKVLSLDKKEMVACAKWFRNSGALTDDDLLVLSDIAKHRNTVAHELPSLLSSVEQEVSLTHLRCIFALIIKIDKWWLREVELSINPAFDERQPTDEELEQSCSMRMLFMSLLVQVAEGDDSKLAELYEEWRKQSNTAKQRSSDTAEQIGKTR